MNPFLPHSIFEMASPAKVIFKKEDYSIEELNRKLFFASGQMHISGFDSISKCERQQRSWQFQPILISERVLNGFKRERPEDKSTKEGWWKIPNWPIKDIEFPVYGADLHWIF